MVVDRFSQPLRIITTTTVAIFGLTHVLLSQLGLCPHLSLIPGLLRISVGEATRTSGVARNSYVIHSCLEQLEGFVIWNC